MRGSSTIPTHWPPASHKYLCTPRNTMYMPVGAGGLERGQGCPRVPTNRPVSTVPVPSGGSSVPQTAEGPRGLERIGSVQGRGPLSHGLHPSPEGPLMAGACQVKWAVSALQAHAFASRATAERHHFLLNMFLLSGEMGQKRNLHSGLGSRLLALQQTQASEASGPSSGLAGWMCPSYRHRPRLARGLQLPPDGARAASGPRARG